MMAGRDSGHLLSLADWLVTFPCSAAAPSSSSTSATAASISTRPSAPAATRAPFSPPPNCTRDRHRPRPAARSRRRRPGERGRRPADAGRGPLLQSRGGGAQPAATTRSTASCSISASRRCSSTRPSAASRSASTARSTCAWAAPARAPPTWWRTPPSAISPRSSRRSARSAMPAPSPAPSCARAREAPIAHHARAGRDRRARRACAPGRDPSGDAHVPGAAHLRQRGARRAGGRACTPPSACSRPAAGWSWSSFHSLEDRIVKIVPRRARPARRRLAPPAGSRAAGAARFRLLTGRPGRGRTTPRSPPIRARARPSCAPPSAPTRRPAARRRRAAAAAAVARRRDAGGAAMMRLLNICVIAALVAGGGLCLQDQVRVDAAGRAGRQAAHGDPARARRHRGAARGMGEARQSGAHPGAGASAISRSSRSSATQFDRLDNLPERPPDLVPPDAARSDRRR